MGIEKLRRDLSKLREALPGADGVYCTCNSECGTVPGAPIVYVGRDDNPPIPEACDQCGRPFSPDTIRFIEIEVVDSRKGAEIEPSA